MKKSISHKKLWKLLIEKRTAVELREKTGIAPNTMTRLCRDGEVSMAVLIKICTALESNIGGIMDVVPGNRNSIMLLSVKGDYDGNSGNF